MSRHRPLLYSAADRRIPQISRAFQLSSDSDFVGIMCHTQYNNHVCSYESPSSQKHRIGRVKRNSSSKNEKSVIYLYPQVVPTGIRMRVSK